MLLPLSVRILSEASVSVLYLLLSVVSLQVVLNFGFQPTFARLVAYATAGLSVELMSDLRIQSDVFAKNAPTVENEDSLGRVCGAMRKINRRIALISVLFLGTLGSIAMLRPISELESSMDGWMAWGIIIFGSYLKIRFSNYQIFLNGSGQVALVQRWQALFSALSLGSMIVAICVTDSISLIIFGHQAWVLIGLLCFYRMAKESSQQRYTKWERTQPDARIKKIAWDNAWRSGLGIAGSKLSQQSLGFFYAQFGSSASVATFLIGMRLIEAVENFAMAPFYSRLPKLNQFRAQGRHRDLEESAARGMQGAHWVYFFGFVIAAAIGPILLNHKNSNVGFPEPTLWLTLGLAFMLQRFGGMHLQLYSTTNHIIWHWVSLAQGCVILALATILAPLYGAIGLAVSILMGNLVYAATSANASRTQLQKPLLIFESVSFLPPLFAFASFAWMESTFQITSNACNWIRKTMETIIGFLY